jgi:hypothetical protein
MLEPEAKEFWEPKLKDINDAHVNDFASPPQNCNCENLHCHHKDEACPNVAGKQKAMWVGPICDTCAEKCQVNIYSLQTRIFFQKKKKY